MIPEVRFTVDGPVVGKGRPRFARLPSGGVRTFTPAKTESYENRIAGEAQRAIYGQPLLVGPVTLDVVAWVAVPASWPTWKRNAALAGQIAPTTKPDLDNIAKILADALNGIVWGDDTQVVHLSATKLYGEKPHLAVMVREHHGLPAQVTRRPVAA